jgi:uncharacterized delta-60 repeat protein
MNKVLFFSGLFLLALSAKTSAQQVGTNDATFNPGTGSNSDVSSVAIQTDGKILAAGTFTTFNGVAKNRITRLNADGSADPTFTVAAGANNSVYKVGTLSSGKLLACGQFTTYAGVAARRLVRINTNGTRDAAFVTSSTGANNYVMSFVEQPDAKIIIVGGFTSYGGVNRYRVARVTTTGANDATFAPGTGANNNINAVALQADGKILIGGVFTTFNGTSKVRLARLTSTGANDATFAVGTGVVGTGTTAAVHAITVQPDGKVLVGGLFTTYNGTAKTNLIRLNSDGSLDASFVTGTGPTGGYVKQIILQPDGKIILVGSFTAYNGTAKAKIVRLNANGSIDNTFGGTGANNTVLCGALQADAELVIGGTFSQYSGVARATMARVYAACPTLSLSLTGQTNNTCNGDAAGTATVSATGGTTFTYSWMPGGGTAAAATGLAAGTYTCLVSNECLNTATVSVTITEPGSVLVTAGSSFSVCTGSNAVLSASASGGTGAFTYNWMPGNLSGSGPTVNPVSSTTYTVIATDANGCTSAPATQMVATYTAPTISISGGNSVICSGSTVTLTASGGLSYNWSNGSNTASTLVSPASTTAFTVTGTDANGCTNTASKTVTVSGTCATSSVPCGITITNLNATSSAANVTGAVNYRFKFYNSSTNALLGTRVQASRTFTFNTMSNILFYGNTYKWTVAVDKGSGFGPESPLGCTVTFPAPQSTVPCGVSYSNLSAYTTAQFVSAAQNYRFTFYNNVTNALVAVKTQTSNYIYFNQVGGLAYGNTYKWTVEVEYNNGSTLLFGPASSSLCTVTFNPPQTTVPCGNTYSKNGYTTVSAVQGGNAYRYTFYDAVTSAMVATVTNTNTYIYFNQVPGLILDKSYNWTVEVRYNNGSGNVFGPASTSSCIMNYGSPSSFITNGGNVTTEENSAARIALQQPAGNNDEQLRVTLYPNPAKDNVRIEASEMVQQVKVYNVAGELVLSPESTDTINVKDLKAGVYMISVQTGTGLKHLRLIKE